MRLKDLNVLIACETEFMRLGMGKVRRLHDRIPWRSGRHGQVDGTFSV
ncbi:hypothetical protein [Bradyrhizobium sp. UFLA05-112]